MLASLELFEALKARFDDTKAREIVKIFEEVERGVEVKIDKKFDDKAQIFKDDIKSLKEYMDKAFATKEDLAKLETKLADVRADMIKWMFIFWIGQVAVMAGMLAYFFHK